MRISLPAGLQMAVLTTLISAVAVPRLDASIDFITVSSTQFFGGNANNYDSIAGLSHHLGGSVTATFTSTPSTNITGLTSASVSTTASLGTGIVATAASSASANLATGAMRVYATGNCAPANIHCAGEAFASATMRDLLTFDNISGVTQDITVSFAFDGTITLGGPVDRNTQNIALCFITGTSGCLGVSQEFTYNASASVAPTVTKPTTGWVSASILPGVNGYSDTFTGVFAVPVGVSHDFMSAVMSMDCGIDGTTCDFSHTGVFDISLPTGVSFTSASGVLLTEANLPTPEPAKLGWIGLPLLAACIYSRKRRRSAGVTSPAAGM